MRKLWDEVKNRAACCPLTRDSAKKTGELEPNWRFKKLARIQLLSLIAQNFIIFPRNASNFLFLPVIMAAESESMAGKF